MSYAPGPPPGQPPIAARPGELGDRFVARLIDGILLAVAYLLLSVVFGALFLHGYRHSFGERFLYVAATAITSTALWLGYFGYLESTRGQTIGKMVMKLQTVGPSGGRPTMEQAVRRNVFLAAPLLTVIPVIGPFLTFAVAALGQGLAAVGINSDSRFRQGWHDLFAGGTHVLKVG